MRAAYKILIVVVSLLVILAGLYFYTNSLLNFVPSLISSQGQQVQGAISLQAGVSHSSVVAYNNSAYPLFYTLLTYSTANVTYANVSFDVYKTPPFRRIYLVNVSGYCSSCFSEDALRAALASSLQQFDLLRNASSFNYVSLSQLSLIPNNSTVIVPSGLLPFSMLNGTGTSLFTLLNSGDTVIYVGQDFSHTLGPNGVIFVTPQQTSFQLNKIGLATGSYATSLQKTPQFNLTFRNPLFSYANGQSYKNITYTSAANGTMIAFSNYPKSSWNVVQDMASDIATVINSRLWMAKLASSKSVLDVGSKPSGSVGLTSALTSQSSFTYSFSGVANGTYSLVSVVASNSKGSVVREIPFINSFSSQGSISVPTAAGATQIVPVVLQVNGVTKRALFHIDVYDLNLTYISSIPIPSFINSSYSVQQPHAFDLPGGYYFLYLKDFNNRPYAATFFAVDQATILPTLTDFKNGTFSFLVTSHGFPVTNTSYSININGEYNTSGELNSGVISYTLPKGAVVNYGNQNFNFHMLGTSYVLSSSYQQTIYRIPAIYIEIAVTIIVVVLLNLVLKPPNRDDYFVDVPEFPTVKREKVKLKSGDLLSVFDKVNYYYRWKYMPLTAEEVKLGIGNNVRISNMPIAVTLQNTNLLLSTLAHDGALVSASGYFAPKAWVDASRHSVEYLIIFRKLRDYCVSHAMLFTDLDANPSADMLISREGKQTNVYVHAAGSKMKPITLSRDTRTAIVFLNEEAVHDFMDELYDSLDPKAELLKLGIEYNYMRLIDADHLDRLQL